ncbi:MAG TPA: ABC transporter ATP-binding protein [Rubrivivax sp.]|nr:ABC transporter ATP-binding protein [Burkholderiales bacterium]HNU12337.1 ABC transporter ATP-binding protein [Rubrivivax sp.]
MEAAAAGQGTGFLRVEGVSKRYGQTLAVDDISLSITKNEIFALLGSSGCGKSTLLRMIAGFETPSAGRIVLDGEDMTRVSPHHRPTNMMFQSYALFPHLTVRENVAFGLRQIRPALPRGTIDARVDALLDLVQLRPLATRKPSELSGGQQQRVALARSLAREPKLLLLDEPLSALDKKIRQRTQLELVELIRRVGVTCIMVTHDQEEAMAMADRIGIMSPHGTLLQVGAPGEVYEHPRTRYIAGFVGETNLFEGRFESGRLACPGLPQPLALPAGTATPEGTPAWLSVRPERITLHGSDPGEQAGNRIAGRVGGIAYLGSHSIIQVEIGGGRTVTTDHAAGALAQRTPATGEAVWVAWPPENGVVLTQ